MSMPYRFGGEPQAGIDIGWVEGWVWLRIASEVVNNSISLPLG
jgi:hypothetical protein